MTEEIDKNTKNANISRIKLLKEGKLIDDTARRAAVHLLTEIALHPENRSFTFIIDSYTLNMSVLNFEMLLKDSKFICFILVMLAFN